MATNILNQSAKRVFRNLRLSAISCLFYRILKGLEDMIGNILRQIINKVLNSAECLVESLLAGIIGNKISACWFLVAANL